MDEGEERTRLSQILNPQKRAQIKRRGKEGAILQAGPTICPNQFHKIPLREGVREEPSHIIREEEMGKNTSGNSGRRNNQS
jgi:hypothetical protein